MHSERVDGRLVASPKTFPKGMKNLAAYIHGLGLKLGIYSSAGTKTCENLPASLNHEKIDAETFASWDIDYLKYDNCHNEGISSKIRFKSMGDALKASGRNILFSACQWGEDDPATWIKSAHATSWRTTGDIKDNYYVMHDIIHFNDRWAPYAGLGAWNDPDMLEVGVHHGISPMNIKEYKTHFSLWVIAKSPLLLGNDLTKMSDEIKQILMNKEIIAVNQDVLGIQARLISSSSTNGKKSALLMRKCIKAPEQMWTFHPRDGKIESKGLPGRCIRSEDNNLFVGDCHGADEWIVTRVANRIMISTKSDPDKCIRVWNDGVWSGPDMLLQPCKREFHQAFNYTESTYIRWNFVLNIHMPESWRTNDGCVTADTQHEKEVWGGPLSGGRFVVALHNRGLEDIPIRFDFNMLGLVGKWKVRDLWKRQDLGEFTEYYESLVASHDVILVVLSK